MERPEFMRMKLSDLPPEFVKAYNLDKLADHNGNVYIKVQKGMYGLPQAGILAHQLLEQRLNEHHGYQKNILAKLIQNENFLLDLAIKLIVLQLCNIGFDTIYCKTLFFDTISN